MGTNISDIGEAEETDKLSFLSTLSPMQRQSETVGTNRVMEND